MNKGISHENELLARLKVGDTDAYTQLYDKYHPALYAYALKFVKIPEVAEDILQEVFIKLWEIRERIDSDLSFNAYLYRITRNCVFKLLKKISKDDEMRVDIAYKLINSVNTAELKLQWQQYEAILNNAINALPPQRQKVFKLCRQENKSYEEVAAVLNISRNTIKEHMVQAVRSIKDYMWTHADIQFVLLYILFTNSASQTLRTLL